MGDLEEYSDKQRILIESWRKLWNDEQLSFYYVQLAPHIYSQRRNDVEPKTCWTPSFELLTRIDPVDARASTGAPFFF